MLEIGLVFGSVGLLVGALSTVAVMRLVARARLQQLELERRIEREHARLQLETLHERLSHQQEQREQLELTFRGLAAETLNASTREFKGQAERALQSLLQPLGLELRTFREAVQQSGKETFALKQHVDRLGQQSVALSDQAQQLTTALKGDLRVQGAWGELMLERVLELSGLVAGREYQLQLHVAGPDGAARPDAVIFLPDDRRLVIDAKVSLTAYERYSRAEDDGAADEAQRAHAQSLRSHIKQLAEKRYAERVPGRSLDFVLMFVPLEAALVVALRQAPELLEESHRLGVLPVTPSNLLVTLKTIEHLWRTQRQQRNAEAIAERAGRLYDKFVGFVEDLGEVGRRLDQAKAAHERAVGKLSRGRGNLVRQAETLREMGAQSRHQLPHELREDDTLEAEPGAIGQEPTPRSPAHSA